MEGSGTAESMLPESPLSGFRGAGKEALLSGHSPLKGWLKSGQFPLKSKRKKERVSKKVPGLSPVLFSSASARTEA